MPENCLSAGEALLWNLTLDRPFALLSRSQSEHEDLELLSLQLHPDLDLEDVDGTSPMLVVVPYREIRRRGLEAVDDGTPLLVFDVLDNASTTISALVAVTNTVEASTVEFKLVPDDAVFAAQVDQLIHSHISTGQGANFVLHRELVANLGSASLTTMLRALAVLLLREHGSYWTFLVWTGEEFLLGASPEPHAALHNETVSMTPISGTLTLAEDGLTEGELISFLTDTKETEELSMVLDEELKMMAAICQVPPTVSGPSIRTMSHVLHTEYRIEGVTHLTPGGVLAATLLAPTIIGSPLSSACRIVAEQSPHGRGYYGGVLALTMPKHGRPQLDSCILIRTARIDLDGRVRAAVGATIVRHSTGAGEASETRGKRGGNPSPFVKLLLSHLIGQLHLPAPKKL